MIAANQFVGSAKQLGFDFWAGVPCSFLTPFINYTIGDKELTYISSANEGDAVAAATGETVTQIKQLGFDLADPLYPSFDPEPAELDHYVDWDEAQSERYLLQSC